MVRRELRRSPAPDLGLPLRSLQAAFLVDPGPASEPYADPLVRPVRRHAGQVLRQGVSLSTGVHQRVHQCDPELCAVHRADWTRRTGYWNEAGGAHGGDALRRPAIALPAGFRVPGDERVRRVGDPGDCIRVLRGELACHAREPHHRGAGRLGAARAGGHSRVAHHYEPLRAWCAADSLPERRPVVQREKGVCACGRHRGLSLFSFIQGRSTDVLLRADGQHTHWTTMSYAIKDAFTPGMVLEHQARQKSLDERSRCWSCVGRCTTRRRWIGSSIG